MYGVARLYVKGMMKIYMIMMIHICTKLQKGEAFNNKWLSAPNKRQYMDLVITVDNFF